MGRSGGAPVAGVSPCLWCRSHMKVFILTSPLDGTGPVWMSIFWPHYAAIADSVPTELLTVPDALGGAYRPRLDRLKFWKPSPFGDGAALRRQVLARLDENGPNILIVWALGCRDLERADLLAPIKGAVDRRQRRARVRARQGCREL